MLSYAIKTDDIKKKKGLQNMLIEKTLTLSTAHLTEHSFALLQTEQTSDILGLLTYSLGTESVVIYIVDEMPFGYEEQIPYDLYVCLQHAVYNKCSFLIFDVNGPIDPQLRIEQKKAPVCGMIDYKKHLLERMHAKHDKYIIDPFRIEIYRTGLPIRITNAIQRYLLSREDLAIVTLGDISRYLSRRTCENIRGLGKNGFMQLLTVMNDYGINFADESPNKKPRLAFKLIHDIATETNENHEAVYLDHNDTFFVMSKDTTERTITIHLHCDETATVTILDNHCIAYPLCRVNH